MPVAGTAIFGSASSGRPKPAAPVNSTTPETKMATVTMPWTIAAVRMPTTLIQVIATAPARPTRMNPASTGAPATCQSAPMRIAGIRYSTAVGSATDSNTHTVT